MASITSAAPVHAATPVTFTGSVDAAGTKWKAFSVSLPAGPVTVTLDWINAAADLNPFLETTTGTIIAFSSSKTARPEVITATITSAGTYKVAAKAITGASAFTLTVDTGSSDGTAPMGTDWPMFHRNAVHDGITPDTTIKASNASGLTVQWQSNTGAGVYGSPAVVYNATLKKTLLYVGNQSGVLGAYDALTGDRIWYARAGASLQSSPAVYGNVVYVGSNDKHLYLYDATTGAPICNFNSGGVFSSSPVVVDPDGSGPVAYVGDNGLSGADDGGNVWAVNADCTVKWRFNGYSNAKAGTWSPPAFGRLATGRGVVVFGGSSPDNAAYAVDALTGVQLWRFQTDVFEPDDDVGAGPTISPPGVNGFADGVAYIAGKDRIVYALNLLTGAEIWDFRIYNDMPGVPQATRATPALDGNVLYVGAGKGIYSLNATTGAKNWRSDAVGTASAEVLSSPAVSGPDGDKVVFAGDVSGKFLAWNAQTGAMIFSYKTSNYIFSSPAVVGGQVYFGSGDNFLYAFGFGGQFPTAKPDTSITSPATGSTLDNTGSIHMTGNATDDVGVTKVLVAAHNLNTDRWYSGATGKWQPVYTSTPATLASPNAASTGWTFDVPVDANGGPIYLQAEAVDGSGQHDSSVASVNVTVSSLTNPPTTTITSPKMAQVFYFPNGVHASFPITVSGSSTDTAGAHPGVAQVFIVIKNIEHGEYYCGFSGCAGGAGETSDFTATYTALAVPINNAGATTVDWSFTFPTYDHPHKYRLTAWAVDNDGNVESVRAVVGRICVNDPGNPACQ